MTGTFINVGTVLAGTLVGTLAGGRLPEGLQQRVLAGLGLVTLVIGVDGALAWEGAHPRFALGGVLIIGISLKPLDVRDYPACPDLRPRRWWGSRRCSDRGGPGPRRRDQPVAGHPPLSWT